MKKMRRFLCTGLCAALMLIMAGCAASPSPDVNPEASVTPSATNAPEAAAGPLTEACRAFMAAYEAELNRIAPQCEGNLTYAIPGDMLAKMAADGDAMQVSPEAGRYQFTWRQESENSYVATGLEVQEEMAAAASPEPDAAGDMDEDSPMDSQQMGDFSAVGGGLYARSAVYDVAENLTDGTMEITDLLNGETTGHELFSFVVRDGALYFVDAALDLTVTLDEIESTGAYLVAAGVLEKDGVEIVEYRVPSQADVPQAALADWNAVLTMTRPLSRLTAHGAQVRLE